MSPDETHPVSVGIAGWSYADWKDIVYPPGKVDQLVYVSDFVDCVEINSTFYRPPFERTVRSWLNRTSDKPDFFFTAKLNREFTGGTRRNGSASQDVMKHITQVD